MASQGTPGGEAPRTHRQGTSWAQDKRDGSQELACSLVNTSRSGPNPTVLANSSVASLLTLLHGWQLHQRRDAAVAGQPIDGAFCLSPRALDLLVVGIVANYAAVTADTFSSELGILARSRPRLITSWSLRPVPRGTNGGVTLEGLAAGALGAVIVVAAALPFMPFCSDVSATAVHIGGGKPWSKSERTALAAGLVLAGVLGSLVDSFLGGWLQRTVRDVRSGKVVEGEGGVRVLVSGEGVDAREATSHSAATTAARTKVLRGEGTDAIARGDKVGSGSDGEEWEKVSSGGGGSDGDKPASRSSSTDRYDPHDRHRASTFGDEKPTRVAESGMDLLDNNDVNFLMALAVSWGAMAAAGWYFGVPLSGLLRI